MFLRLVLPFLVLLPASLRAEAPRVVADIAPVHSLVARVMDGVGQPDLILSPGASPHGYAMRPSEAAALQAADLVVWIGPELTPWLARALESLSGDAGQLRLLADERTARLPVRQSARFEHDHGGHDEHGSEHAHEHSEHANEHEHSEHAHEDHGHEHDDHDASGEEGHAHHGGEDPHAWLDPENARAWLDRIAAELARIDPENAQTYRENAETARAELATLAEEIRATLAPVGNAPLLVYHDAYQYFERRFDLNVVGAVAISDAVAPGAARMAELRDLVAETEPRCAFHEPQFSPDLVQTLAQGTGIPQAELDPVGQALTPGPELYPALLRNMAQGIAGCR